MSTFSTLWRLISALLRVPIAASAALLPPARVCQSRRDLLQGRFWKRTPHPKFAPLIMRYPKAEKASGPPVRTIQGISIEPVRTTQWSSKAAPHTIPIFRPPGAITESQFLTGCTRCGDCITACPYDALIRAPDRLGPVAGTPIIEADTSACQMCDDFPCIASCQPGVLIDSVPPVMGTAQVTEHLCLAHHGTTCTLCSERCPVEGAITLTDGRPRVNEDTCTGCGVCRFVCPAPENAILLMPAYSRPGLPHI
jgi:MauM/NapG family ferredoxin protein